MKIKLEVDVNQIMNELFEDSWRDEECPEIEMKDEIQKQIIFQTKNAIMAQIKPEIKDQISSRVKILVQDEFGASVEKLVDDFSKNGKLKGRYSGDEERTVSKYIEDVFQNQHGKVSSTTKNIIEKHCKKISEELRKRYDLLFASSLVAKMNDQGLLKDGVFNALMAGKK